jgi:hypothetical protein
MQRREAFAHRGDETDRTTPLAALTARLHAHNCKEERIKLQSS